MELGLKGKHALITGASRGIGKAVAKQLGLEGVNCTICSRNPESLACTANELSSLTGQKYLPVAADISNRQSIENFVQKAADEFGHIDILVNCAARVMTSESKETLQNTHDEMVMQDFQEKFLGYLRCIRSTVPFMIKAGGGRIVNISGSSARFGGFISAGARNAAVVNLSKSLSIELAPHKIYVNSLLPGITKTEAYEAKMLAQASTKKISADEHISQVNSRRTIGRVVTADELAKVVVFLCSPCAIGINGECIAVTGGERNIVLY